MQNEILTQVIESASKVESAIATKMASEEGQFEIRKQLEACAKFIAKESAKRDDIRPESAQKALDAMRKAEKHLLSLLNA